MVGIGERFDLVVREEPSIHFETAFIEKLMNLDDKKKYFVITCGEEVHFAYNRVG